MQKSTRRQGYVYKLWLRIGTMLGYHDEDTTTTPPEWLRIATLLKYTDDDPGHGAWEQAYKAATKAYQVQQLQANVVNWGKRKGIIGGVTKYRQMTTVMEELGELS